MRIVVKQGDKVLADITVGQDIFERKDAHISIWEQHKPTSVLHLTEASSVEIQVHD